MSYRVVATLALALALAPTLAHAQAAGRARPTGPVSGLELGMEGSLRAPRGTTLRWLLTAYEVVGTNDLRRAPGATVEVTTSLDASADPVSLTTDMYGRVIAEIPVPSDAPDTFGIVLRAATAGAARRFELRVAVDDPRSLELFTARSMLRAGAPVHAFGRLSQQGGQAIAGETVELELRDDQGRPVGRAIELRTDASGLYAHVFRPRRDLLLTTSALSVVARVLSDEEHPIEASRAITLVEPDPPALLVAIAPARTIVPPDAEVPLEIAVRTSEGRPVERAQIEIPWLPREDPRRILTTDARGRARTTWTAPRRTRGAYGDVGISLSARREGIGQGTGDTSVRVATSDWALGVAVEGGALVPSLGGRVYVRVVGIDGLPVGAGVPVSIAGSRVLRASATTDASGIAVLDISLGPPPADPQADPCGGSAATSIQAIAGSVARQGRRDACVPLDADGTLRVRAASPRLAPGAPLAIDVTRVAAVARMPVVVSVLGIDAGHVATVATTTLPAGTTHADIPLPERPGTALLVRARPLDPSGRELRGGSVTVSVEPADRITVDASLSASGQLAVDAGGAGSVWSVALPIDEARSLEDELRAFVGIRARVGYDPARASDAFLEALLAVYVPPDAAAPFVLREGRVVPLPAPDAPTEQGLLRDPWRAAARFVTGRLALVFSAVEQQVDRSVPEHIDDVAVLSGGRWEFNRQILAAIAESGELGAEGATALGGDPLSVDALRRIDPAFTYDAVARRITRERLYHLLIALRRFVIQNGFDLDWSRLGDPAAWLRHLVGTSIEGGRSLQARELVDAWGRPFVLRRGRSRYTGITPLDPGWELFSSGPDGRPGTGDDVYDPTARVLPSGSAYADAVGEDLLVARLSGVELGRATVELLRGTGRGGSVGGIPASADAAALRQSELLFAGELPDRFEPDPDPLALRRPARPGDGAGGSLGPLDGPPIQLDLDDEPRAWGAVVVAFRPDGAAALATARTHAGSTLIVEGGLPERVRVGSPVTLPLRITNAGEADLQVSAAVSGGSLQGSASPVSLAAGTSTLLEITLRAVDAGRWPVTLELRSGERVLRTLRSPMSADRSRHPIRVRAASVVGGALLPEVWSTTLRVPAGDAGAGRVVLVSARGAARDPDLVEVRTHDPALLAWAATVTGTAIDTELRAHLLAAQEAGGIVSGADPNVSTACALVAWSSADEHDDASLRAAALARRALGAGGTAPDDDGTIASVRSAAQELTALAVAGSAEPAGGRLDPVGERITALRRFVRAQLRAYPAEPSVLARGAAALLVADPRDAHGRAMFERALEAVGPVEGSPGGLRVAPSSAREGLVESLSATLALALAAHQLGREGDANRLLGGALHDDHVMVRAAGEPLFWWLAAAAYGALGAADGEPSVEVEVRGQRSAAGFEHGIAIVPIASVSGGSDVSISLRAHGGVFLARAEVALGARFRARDAGPVELALEGDPGSLGDVAALELALTPRREVRRLYVEIQLPPGVPADERLLGALRSAPSVMQASARDPGFVRVTLEGLAQGSRIALPLPLRWGLGGSLEGLGAVAWSEGSPADMSALAPRAFEIARRPERE